MFCFHKYGKVVDGFQYCEKCGKANFVKTECNHEFVIIERNEVFDAWNMKTPKGVIYVSRCSKCGAISKDKVGL